jgi:hypothetical protein
LLRLQGFPETFKTVVSHGEIRKQTGNSVPVNVVRAIAKQIFSAIPIDDPKSFECKIQMPLFGNDELKNLNLDAKQ